jgi:hypothetical protein
VVAISFWGFLGVLILSIAQIILTALLIIVIQILGTMLRGLAAPGDDDDDDDERPPERSPPDA